MWRETKILLIDDDSVRRRDLAVILNFLGEENLPCGSHDWQQAASSLSSSREVICVLIGTVNAPGAVLGLLKTLSTWDEFLPVLLIGDISSVELPEDQRRRVLSSLEMPPSYSKLLDSLHRAQVYREMYDQARERGRHREPNLFRSLVGTSRAIQHVRQMMQQVADTDASVLILGESGTGKEVVARNLHYHSKRRDGPFVPVNCGAIPAELLESELFGHEKGAFTGAITSRAGRFELANGGTLFLDEIGDMPYPLQARLLRVLQERTVTPLGSARPVRVDVELVCATNHNLRQRIAAGLFREDLYYRLNCLVVKLPPLRARNDLSALVRNILAAEADGKPPHIPAPSISDEVLHMFARHRWPGNLRQLASLLRTAAIMAGQDEIGLRHLPDDFLDDIDHADHSDHSDDAHPASASASGNGKRKGSGECGDPLAGKSNAGAVSAPRLGDMTLTAILGALDAHGGNVSAAARALGISRNTIYRKLPHLKLPPLE